MFLSTRALTENMQIGKLNGHLSPLKFFFTNLEYLGDTSPFENLLYAKLKSVSKSLSGKKFFCYLN